MEKQKLKSYNYRWVVLFVFMLMMAMQQLLWITFAAITTDAAAYFKVSELNVGILSMVFMIVYIFASIPASWLIDTYGFHISVGIGSVLTGVFGLLRGLFPYNYTWVLIFQIGIAVGQPFIVNAVTKVAARWFPMKERGTASGLSWLAGYLGLIIGLVLTPYLIMSSNIQKMLLYYGIISLISAIFFIIFAKEHPRAPQCNPDEEERSLVFDGLKQMIVRKDFIYLMIIFFIGLGVFNGLSTWIENILRPRGFTSIQAGIIGGSMVLSGVIGSAIIPLLSDKLENRVGFIILAIAGSIPGLIGITYATNFYIILISAFSLGFFMLSCAPLGFQYGAEIAYPAPEGTSNGILMMMGQISGIIFIFGMDALKSSRTGSMTMPMNALILLMLLTAVICSKLKEASKYKK